MSLRKEKYDRLYRYILESLGKKDKLPSIKECNKKFPEIYAPWNALQNTEKIYGFIKEYLLPEIFKKYEINLRKCNTPQQKKLYKALFPYIPSLKVEYNDDGYKHIDLYIPEIKMGIELDGKQHLTFDQKNSDYWRSYYSYKNNGITTIHFFNEYVDNNLERLVKDLLEVYKNKLN